MSMMGNINAIWVPRFISSGSVLWTPTQLTGYYQWLDADVGVTSSGGRVSAWVDQSSNAVSYSQGTGSLKPSVGSTTLNGKDVVESFDINSYLAAGSTDMQRNTSFRCFVGVIYPASFADRHYYWYSNINTGANSRGGFGVETSGNVRTQFRRLDDDSNSSLTGVAITSAAWSIVSAYQDSSADTRGTSVNGAPITTASDPLTTGNTSDTAASSSYVFTNPSLTTGTNAKIAEMVYFQDSTVSTRQKVEGYLAWKFGLEGSLDSGHPYKSAAPTV